MYQIIAMIISFLAAAVVIASYQMVRKKVILLMQSVGCALFVISYIFADGGIGAFFNGINMVRFAFIAFFGQKMSRKAEVLVAVSTYGLYVISYFVYLFAINTQADKLWNLIPLIGIGLGTVGLAFKKENQYRFWKIFEHSAFIVYNIPLGIALIGGLLCDSFAIVSSVIAIIRYTSLNKKKSSGKDDAIFK